MGKTIIYTCIVGNYDELRQPQVLDERFEYLCFVRRGAKITEKMGAWTVVELGYDNANPAILARYPKLNPHKVLPKDCDYSVWLDGDVCITSQEFYEVILSKEASGVLWSGLRHPLRDCAYEEICASFEAGKEKLGPLRRAAKFLRKELFPHHAGLFENSVILRKHGDGAVKKLAKLWWKLFLRYAHRDQIFLPYCMNVNGMTMDFLFPEYMDAATGGMLDFGQHNPAPKQGLLTRMWAGLAQRRGRRVLAKVTQDTSAPVPE